MKRGTLKLYLIFAAIFLIMHFTGMAVMRQPYLINAITVFAVVSISLICICNQAFQKPIKVVIREIGFGEIKLKALLPGLITSLLLVCTYPIIGSILNTKIVLVDQWLFNWIGLFLTAGLAEEMLFRGFLYGGLRKQHSVSKSMIIAAFIFSIAHLLLFIYLSWPVALLSTLLAIGISFPMAYLFEAADCTIWGAALVHTTIRTIGTVFTTSEQHYMQLVAFWMLACLILPYAIITLFKILKLLPQLDQ
ncbi:MAG: CPBP family intramembrane metalloprotease [Chitinophagales bacterium]|nr:CPBP family intramembrane metalloprotease [Chitinophagales bacterium]